MSERSAVDGSSPKTPPSPEGVSIEDLIRKAEQDAGRLSARGQDVSSVTAKLEEARARIREGDPRTAEMLAREAIILAKVLGRVRLPTGGTTLGGARVSRVTSGATGMMPSSRDNS